MRRRGWRRTESYLRVLDKAQFQVILSWSTASDRICSLIDTDETLCQFSRGFRHFWVSWPLKGVGRNSQDPRGCPQSHSALSP